MQENLLSDLPPLEIEASGIQKFFSYFIDIAIELTLIFSVFWLTPGSFRIFLAENRPFANYATAFIIIWGYRFFFILKFGRTLGMMMVSTKYLNADLLPLNRNERLTIAFRKVRSVRQYKLNAV